MVYRGKFFVVHNSDNIRRIILLSVLSLHFPLHFRVIFRLLHNKVAVSTYFIVIFFHEREAIIHALVIVPLTNFVYSWDYYTRSLLYTVFFSYAQSAHTCDSDRSFNKLCAFWNFYRKRIKPRSGSLADYHVFSTIHTLALFWLPLPIRIINLH